jgi:pimeloyl-ACP methyl ester carboxylesterase
MTVDGRAVAIDEQAKHGDPRDVRVAALQACGLRTRVLEAGPEGSNEAVVFLHGSPGSANDWEALLPLTGAFARSVAFDLPGFGEADKPSDWAYAPESFATFIAGALNALAITRAHLVMSDLGGVGLFWAAAHPNALASAVMIDTGVFIDYRWHLIARLHRTPLLGRVVALTARPGLSAVMRFYGRGAPNRVPAQVIDGWRERYDWPTRRAMLRFYRATPAGAFGRLAPALRPLDRPALILWGAHDRFVPVEQAGRQHESFPSARVSVLEDSGHYPHVDDPRGVAGAIVAFLQRHCEYGGGRDEK